LQQDNFDLLYDIVQNETAVSIPTTPVANPPAPPLNLTPGALTSTSAVLNWTAPSGAAPTTYNIYKKTGSTWGAGTPSSATHPTVTSTQTGLTTATTYSFRVTAVTGGIESGYSNEITIVTP
jgi:Tfp pilus assembly protein PilX